MFHNRTSYFLRKTKLTAKINYLLDCIKLKEINIYIEHKRYYKHWHSETILKKSAGAPLREKSWKAWQYHSISLESIVILLDIWHPHNWQLFFLDAVGTNHMSAWLDKVANKFLITAWAQILFFLINFLTKLIAIVATIIIRGQRVNAGVVFGSNNSRHSYRTQQLHPCF